MCLDAVVPPAIAWREDSMPPYSLNEQGETLDSLYRYAYRRETEEAFGTWLRSTISNLEEQAQRLGHVAAQSSHQINLTPVDEENGKSNS
jgi:hypothetical protein